MQWLAALCVRRPVFATVLILMLTVVGAFSFTQLGGRSPSQGRLPDRRCDDPEPGRRTGGDRDGGHRQDRGSGEHRQRHRRASLDVGRGGVDRRGHVPAREGRGGGPVSYTHLTLPTIYSV